MLSSSPVSLICFKPFLSIIAEGDSPVSHISSKISFAIFPLIVPSSINLKISAICSGLGLKSFIV